MSEDDTFARLKRLPFETMLSRLVDYIYANNIHSDSPAARQFLKVNGWTKEELDAEGIKRYSFIKTSS